MCILLDEGPSRSPATSFLPLNVEDLPSKEPKKPRALAREQRTPEPQIHAAEELLFYFFFSENSEEP